MRDGGLPVVGICVFLTAMSFVGSALLWATHDDGDRVPTPPAAGPEREAQTFQVAMKDLKYAPAVLTIAAGDTVNWVNQDPFGHTVTPVDAAQWGTAGSGDDPAEWLEQGDSWSHTFDKPGTYLYYCKPHASKGADGQFHGMVATLLVTASAPPPAAAPGAGGQPPAAAPPPAKPVDVAEVGANASAVPAPIQRNAPAHLTFDLTSKEVVATMADGVTYSYWTFDGQVPGPMLRARVGDTITVNHRNDASSTVSHNIDFHAATGPGGGAKALTAAPGESASLTFKALSPGLFVYHCADATPPVHIGHGMYGLILIEPEGGLPPVDREYYVVQSDFYSPFGAGDKGHHEYDSAKAASEDPTFVVFNGRVGSLRDADRQLQANVGETVRIYFGVGGPNLVSSFHVIGEIFDRVYDQGDLVGAPGEGLQTTLVPAGGAAVVDFKVEVPGDYILVDHSINRVLKGTAGILHVAGEPDPEVFDDGAGR